MKYTLESCTWNITSECSLDCRHCWQQNSGSDLSSEQALDVAKQIVNMKVKKVTLSGGEPLQREDWFLLATVMTNGGVDVSIATNGFNICDAVIQQMKDCGIVDVGISIDGTRQIHDDIRGSGAYDKAMSAIKKLADTGMNVSSTTSLMADNISVIDEMYDNLSGSGLKAWKWQIACPYGNMKSRKDYLLMPEQMIRIIKKCYHLAQKGRLQLSLADCIGYYTAEETYIHNMYNQDGAVAVWKGCSAGQNNLVIHSNGSILGQCLCEEAPGEEAPNLRNRTLREIWEDDKAFFDFRNFNAAKIRGYCRECKYLEVCKGGCAIMRISLGGDFYAENEYCAYRQHMLRSEM